MASWETAYPWSVSSIPRTPGVYMIIAGADIVYVGQAKKLRDRIEEHISDSETNSALKALIKKYNVSIMYFEIADTAKLDDIECDLYDLYKPVCNQISPPRK